MRALLLNSGPDGPRAAVADVDPPEGEVEVAVSHSSLNYKDGLAVTGRGKIVRAPFPFVPGIDLVGTVARSASPRWAEGDAVILTGWRKGKDRWGGFAERAVFGGGPFATFNARPLVEQVSDWSDPYAIARDLAAHLLAPPVATAETDALAEATLLDGVPDNYDRGERIVFWAEVTLTAPAVAAERLRALVAALVTLPEYQLA